MGILDFLRRRKKKVDDFGPMPEVTPPGQPPAPGARAMPMYPRTPDAGTMRAEMDLILSQMETLRIQYEAINARLQNIERVVTEIRGFCR
jgi:hypothetical protein